MKNLFLAISLLCLGVSHAQAPLLFASRLNVTSATGSDPYTLTGVIQDELGLWSAADLNVNNDSIYHLEGSDLLIYRITSISSASGNSFVILVDDIMDSGLLPSTGTDWAAIEFTINSQFPTYIGNLSSPFKSVIDNRFKQRLDLEMLPDSADMVPLNPDINFGGVTTTNVQAALEAIDIRLDTAMNALPSTEIAYGNPDSSGLTSNFSFRYNGGGNLAMTTQDTSGAAYKRVLPYTFLRTYFDSPKRSDDIVRYGGIYSGNGILEKGTAIISVSEIAGSMNHYLLYDHMGRLGINNLYAVHSGGARDTIDAMLNIDQSNSGYWYSKYYDSTGAFKFGIDSTGNAVLKNSIYLDNAKIIWWKNPAGSYAAALRMDGSGTLALRSGTAGTGGIKFENSAGTIGWRMMDDGSFNFLMNGAGNISMNGGWLTHDGQDGDGVFVNAAGFVGIQQGTPTARLHVPANTSTVAGNAAMKFNLTSAVLMTAPEVGALEPVGDKIHYTIPTGTTRKTLAYNQGTATNDSAPTGEVGEHIISLVTVGDAVSFTTATTANITSISLTAGDWDVEGNVNLNYGSATVTQSYGAITTTSTTLPTDGSEVASGVQFVSATTVDGITVPATRISISSTTTVYLVGQATFSAGTASGYGKLRARRIR